MITRIREVRRAKGMTLDEVARACVPPTTSQTIGRLETGMRTVSVGWLNRIAGALGVAAADLVELPDASALPLAAVVDGADAHAPRAAATVAPPLAEPDMVAVQVAGSAGDYRAGDMLWCRRVAPDAFGALLNRDALVPRPGGRFAFGRVIGREGDRLQLLPPGPGARQVVVPGAPWAAAVVRLVREFEPGGAAR